MADIVQLHVAHAHTHYTPHSGDLLSLRVTFHSVTPGQQAPLGRILRNFWLRRRTPRGTPKGGHVTFDYFQ
jgi:hypothetical protein